MKVIFLDIDGVLNTTHTTTRVPGSIFNGLSKKLLRRFQNLVRETGAKVVLSSTWRVDTHLVQHLEQMGLEFLDHTKRLNADRGHEIQLWLNEHPEVEQYVILDDNSDMLDSQLRNFVQTDQDYGLTNTLAYRAAYILKNGPTYIGER